MTIVLLVDDDDISVRETRALLESLGCEVRETRTLDDAGAMVRTGCPDLVMMDLFLPDRAGLVLLRELHKEFLRMPIIALTGESGVTRTDYQRLAMNCGAVGVLTKPFSRIELISMVKDALGQF